MASTSLEFGHAEEKDVQKFSEVLHDALIQIAEKNGWKVKLVTILAL